MKEITQYEYERALDIVLKYKMQITKKIALYEETLKTAPIIVSKDEEIFWHKLNDLSVRALNVLKCLEIKTFGDLDVFMKDKTKKLSDYRGVGKKIATEILDFYENITIKD
jgi:NAD-dependent DNA ligase